MQLEDLPLFRWQPAVKVVPFPLVKRVGKIRDVASKLLTKTTERHADSYRSQVTDVLIRQLDKIGLAEDGQDEQVGAFWSAVELEVARLTYRGRRPGGDAA